MNEAVTAGAAIITSIVGLAIIAVILGQRSQTSQVIQAGSTGLAALINAAVAPVGATNSGITA